jgi:protein phosphatase 1 regulatory subunit 12C
LFRCTGIDAEAARKEEEELMLRDTNQWLNGGCYSEEPHPKTGAMALHVAAAKGYIKVMK